MDSEIPSSPSPSHEFSFTISLHSSSAATTTPSSPTTTTSHHRNNHHHHHHPPAIDLTPADDIFFHGHLLPLHFLSHLPAASPRTSTASHDGFKPDPKPDPVPKPTFHSLPQYRTNPTNPNNRTNNNNINNNNNKQSKSFSISGISKWIKGSDPKEKPEKKRAKFDIPNFLKRYIKMVKPLLSSSSSSSSPKGSKESISYSGNLNPRINPRRELRSLRAEYSAPASMRTSPTNSGRILATNVGVPSPVSESTMEELQSAIQAAIAHCKNSTNSGTVTKTKEKSQEVFSPVPVN